MFLHDLYEVIKNNQFLSAGIGLSSAGLISFWMKDVPVKFWNFLKREFTSELIATNQNQVFYDILKLIEKEYKNKNFRRLKVNNGRYGWGEEVITSIGYGSHYISYKKIPLLITLTKESANQSSCDKETLSVVKIGRKRSIFDDFIKHATQLNLNPENIKIHKIDDNCWCYSKDIKKRKIESVFIEKNKRELLFNNLDKFINQEQWYVERGIPYQLGILLHGSPGTGKTSIVKAIASYLNYPIYYLSSGQLHKIEKAVASLPDKCVLVIEDIDSNSTTHSRENNSEKNSEEEDMIKNFFKANLSEVLNSLDGIFSTHGRILVTTTNHIEQLDKALIRHGRIDIKIEIGFVNKEILSDFLQSFFPKSNINLNNIKIKSNVTVATLQNLVLLGSNEEDIIEFIKLKEVAYV